MLAFIFENYVLFVWKRLILSPQITLYYSTRYLLFIFILPSPSSSTGCFYNKLHRWQLYIPSKDHKEREKWMWRWRDGNLRMKRRKSEDKERRSSEVSDWTALLPLYKQCIIFKNKRQQQLQQHKIHLLSSTHVMVHIPFNFKMFSLGRP